MTRERDGVAFTNLDAPLFDGAAATKRDLVAYFEKVGERLVADLRDRPLSVIRAVRGQAPFMQKNLPSYTPDWVERVTLWSESSHRDVSYALCNDMRTLMWFANQRAIEYHPALVRVSAPASPLYMVLDLDPPSGDDFPTVVRVAALVRDTLAELALQAAVKTSGAKGLHVFVPVADASFDDVTFATRAVAERAAARDPSIATTAFLKEDRGGRVFVDSTRTGGATVVAAYSPRLRRGVPVSFPLSWDQLADTDPRDITIRAAPGLLGERDPWVEMMPAPQAIPAPLIDEGRILPTPRVAAMHEGRRRQRARTRDR